MIKDFLIINFIGKDNKIALKVDSHFYIHDIDKKINNNDQLVLSILNLIKKHKVNFDNKFSILLIMDQEAFSAVRVSLAVAKELISKKINLFGFRIRILVNFC